MLGHLRDRTIARHCLAAFALLALALKIVFPPGFMPGSSVSQPIVICSGQMPEMAMMEHGKHQSPAKAPHQGSDHPCPFAGLGATPLTPDLRSADLTAPAIAYIVPSIGRLFVAPGRGMAAPPPPSHAPPALHA